jgi:predicted transcriptional regulator
MTVTQRTRNDGADDPDLPAADIHDVLRNDRRRMVLELLGESEDPVTVRELSELIAAQAADTNPAPRDVRQSVYISLQQTHLPKLSELGIVSYDENAKTVSPAQNAAEVGVYMEVVPKYGLAWSEYYAALGILGTLVVLAASIGTPFLSALSPGSWALLLFLVVAASAAYQTNHQRSSLVHRLRD